jgi:Protein of unknown function (DUF3551)
MRKIVLVAAALAALPLTSSGARAEGTWCAYDTKGTTNCGFYSYAQCMAALSGLGGSCVPNPNNGRQRD